MARSLLRDLVRGTQQMLTAQLAVAIAAVAVAGWTLTVTSEIIRERNQLRERVIQLEAAMGSSGMVVPSRPATVDQTLSNRQDNGYPPSIGSIGATAPESVRVVSSAPRAAVSSGATDFSPARVLQEIFTPPPPARALVVHARGAADATLAERVARDLRNADVGVIVDILPEHDQRRAGYTYFDGRQSQSAAALVAEFNDAARRAEVAAWSAQLHGVARPAQGEYTPDRVDIVLPALPPPVVPVTTAPVATTSSARTPS